MSGSDPKTRQRYAGRIAALTQRHAVLEDAIDREYLRPVPDTGALQRLKRRRLAVKEELSSLAGETARGPMRPPIVQGVLS